MSGRLTNKKSYCPWNAANVDRVLRDERLEQERIQKLQREEEQSRKRRHDDDGDSQRHVNLFPEAQKIHVNNGDVGKSSAAGILPVPLGGEESSNRKNGRVPFYLQNQSQLEEGKYNDNNYHGIHKNRITSSDQITNAIMRDQYVSREERRKQRDDPMNRFYVDGNDSSYSKGAYSSRVEDGLQSNYHLESSNRMTHSVGRKSNEYRERKSKKRKREDIGDDRSEASSCSSFPSQPSTSSSHDYMRRRAKKKGDKKRSKRSKHSHHSKNTKKRRHKDKKRKHHHRRHNSDDEK